MEELQENGKNLELSSKDVELEFSLNDNVEIEDLYYEIKDLMKKLSSKSLKGFVVLEDIILDKDDILSKFIPLLNIEEASNYWLSLSDKSSSVHTRLTSNPLAYKKALFNFNKDKTLSTKKKTKMEIKKEKQVEMDKNLEIDQYDPLALTALNFDAETFKWINNLIFLNFYNILLKKFKEEVKTIEKEGGGKSYQEILREANESDFLNDYKSLMDNIYQKIDSSIKVHLTKKGVSVVQNIYTGFDTEYYMFEDPIALSKKNILLSAQISVSTRSYLKVPKKVKYVAGALNSLTNDAFVTPRSNKFNYKLFENNVNNCINDIRGMKFKVNDNKIDKLVSNLRSFVLEKSGKDPLIEHTSVCASESNKFSYFEEDNLFVFGLPRSVINNYVYINEGKGFTFSELILKGKEMGKPYLDRDYEIIKLLFKEIEDLLDLESKFDYKGVDLTMYGNDINKDNTNDIINNNNNNDNDDGNNDDDMDYLTRKVVNYDKRLIINKDQEKIESLSPGEKYKKFSRSKLRGDLDLSISRIKNMYVLAHNSSADLSMLDDFNELKENLDIVNKCFVTRGKPLFMHNLNVHIRDTMLLAPAGQRSLEALGEISGVRKIALTSQEKSSMHLLLKENPNKFINYAYKDSMIPVVYAAKIEEAALESRYLGIPLSLSSLGSIYLKDEWAKIGYKGYQLSKEYLIGDSSGTLTPKGLVITGDIGLKLSYFIASYKGGRNESFMYGIDRDAEGNRTWVDYDLTSAYPTGMAILAHPDYWSARNLTKDELLQISDFDLVHNYLVMKVLFEFPMDTKFPSIPVNVDENLTCYPLRGEAVITGIEFCLAKRQGCNFVEIHDIFLIPFTREKVKDEMVIGFRPFFEVVKELKRRRSLHEKKTFGNLLEKEKVNSIYGLTVKGINDKRKFDIKLGKTVRMEANDLSNPIIASWITAFVRSVLGECLHNISKMGGLVVSTTTDGFITNIKDLENKLNNLTEKENYLFKLFSESGASLTRKPTVSLEIKAETQAEGLISWTTRGQFSQDGRIRAATGIQTRHTPAKYLNALFNAAMASEAKTIDFIQSNLTSAKDSYLYGSQVFMNYADRKFRMGFDHKRLIIPSTAISVNSNDNDSVNNTINNSTNNPAIAGLLDTKPLLYSQMAKDLRNVDKFNRTVVYNKFTTKSNNTKYKNNLDLVIRNFVRGWLLFHSELNLPKYKSYNEIISFVKGHQPEFKISKSSIANLKNRPLGIVFRELDGGNPLIKDFLDYVEKKYPDFDKKKFLSGRWMYE